MRVIVATHETQGENPRDFCHVPECEPVMLDDCDGLHEGCECRRSMVGVLCGKGTTTMMVIESDMRRADYVGLIRAANERAGFRDLGVGDEVFEAEAEELLRLAAEFPAGAVIERDGDEFERRA